MTVYNIATGALLLTMASWLFALIKGNGKRIDCVDGDVGKIQIHVARIDEKLTAVKEGQEHIERKLDRLLKLNGGS